MTLTQSKSRLFETLKISKIQMKNRMVMAPMTRSRADENGVPRDYVKTYYAQRSSAGLIISEGTFPSAMGKGYVRTPGIYNPEQIAAWKQVTDAVHENGSFIFCQLMHAGRISHRSFLPNNVLPLAPSAVKPVGQTFTDSGMLDFETPVAMSLAEIKNTMAEYRSAAKAAIAAGFDGVELHTASGYLPEQFLSSKTNLRTDEYGGSIENRARFVIETLKELIDEIGADRVGIKISPEMNFNDIADETPVETYSYLVKEINKLNLAYLHVALFNPPNDYHSILRPLFNGAYLAGGGFTKETGEAMLNENKADAIVYGTAFLANPDLPSRFALGAELNEPDKKTFYMPSEKGYIDYPSISL